MLERQAGRLSWNPARGLCVALLSAAVSIGALAQKAELRLGYFPNITHAQALYGKATGDFDRQVGARIRWVAFNAGPTAIESLFANAVDATFIGPGPTINGYIKSKGERFTIIAGTASGGSGLVVRQDLGLHSDQDFAGKTIATPQLGNTQDVAARFWLASKGYRLHERGGNVTLIPLSNPDQLTLFKKKQIDGAWTVEPWLARLEIEGGGKLFLEEKSLWPDGKFVTAHLVINRTFLADHPEITRNLLAALIDVTQHINADKTAAAAVLNEQLKKETGKPLRHEVMQKCMARVDFTWDPLCDSLKQAAIEAQRVGFLRKKPALDGIYSLTLLNEILRQKGLPTIAGPTP